MTRDGRLVLKVKYDEPLMFENADDKIFFKDFELTVKKIGGNQVKIVVKADKKIKVIREKVAGQKLV